jgi:hypothetical protein
MTSVSWQPPHLGGKAIAQTHCHQHAIMGYDADQALLRAAGVDLEVLDAGCCGLAGNFGFEAGHYDVSRACGERSSSPPCATRPATPWCWRTGSAAAPSAPRSSPPAPTSRSRSRRSAPSAGHGLPRHRPPDPRSADHPRQAAGLNPEPSESGGAVALRIGLTRAGPAPGACPRRTLRRSWRRRRAGPGGCGWSPGPGR